MMGALSSAAQRANTRNSGSSGAAYSRCVATSRHCPAAVRCLTTGSQGLGCDHSAGTTGWPSKCM